MISFVDALFIPTTSCGLKCKCNLLKMSARKKRTNKITTEVESVLKIVCGGVLSILVDSCLDCVTLC